MWNFAVKLNLYRLTDVNSGDIYVEINKNRT